MARLDLRSGGWLLIVTAAAVVGVAAWRVPQMLRSERGAIGDGHDPATYGFDLASLTLDPEGLASSGMPRDGLPPLDFPEMMAGADVPAHNAARRGKYLVPDDRVIGVSLGGEARAYPVRVLEWHEIVNDEVGGLPIAVTWHPLCESLGVFERTVDGRTVELAVSGLVWSSNLLMYDRGGEGDASLWSQLLGRAVAGPAVGARLTRLPASLLRWDEWLRLHPDTLVVRPRAELEQRYSRNPYGPYRMTGHPRFPVVPSPPEGGPPPMTVVVGVPGAGEPVPLAAGGGATTPPGAPGSTIDRSVRPPSLLVPADATEVPVTATWFAWYAHFGGGVEWDGAPRVP